MILQNMSIIRNTRVKSAYYVMGLNFKDPCPWPRPGQFVMIHIPEAADAFLRRPFSIHRVTAGQGRLKTLEILYKVVGKGTLTMARLKKGDAINILGPLGKGFDVPDDIGSAFVVGGGMGIAPLVFLLSELLKKKIHPTSISIFLGAKSKHDLLFRPDIKRTVEKGSILFMTTDDGSMGQKGLITDALEKSLTQKCPDMIYACGPVAMLQKVAQTAARFNVRCRISLETVMACGMGACLGCAVKNSKNPDRYEHVCVDGPVFDLDRFKF